MAEREKPHGASGLPVGNAPTAPTAPTTPTAPTVAELREVNERLLIAGLREQELAAALEAERAQLAAVLAGMADAVLVVDREGRLVRTNTAYTRMFGDADAPLASQDAHGQLFPPDETPQARAGRGEAFRLKFTLTAGDGSLRWFEANGQPLYDHGVEVGVIVIRDITVSSAQRHLQDEFLSLASHELRTPLTSIRGYLDLIVSRAQSMNDDKRLVYYATQAREQTKRLTALVGDLTDVARLESGKLTFHLARLDLGALATRVVETARDLPPGHAIHLDAPTRPVYVNGDAGRLEQAILNLLINAFAYAPDVAPVVVRLRRQGGEVALEVRDRGRGIAAAEIPYLFARFYQGARVDRPSQGGLGLGLFICQEVVAAHGGRIDVASMEGEGTTFTVWLPLSMIETQGS